MQVSDWWSKRRRQKTRSWFYRTYFVEHGLPTFHKLRCLRKGSDPNGILNLRVAKHDINQSQLIGWTWHNFASTVNCHFLGLTCSAKMGRNQNKLDLSLYPPWFSICKAPLFCNKGPSAIMLRHLNTSRITITTIQQYGGHIIYVTWSKHVVWVCGHPSLLIVDNPYEGIDDHQYWQFNNVSNIAHVHMLCTLVTTNFVLCCFPICHMLDTLKIPLVFHHVAAWTNQGWRETWINIK